MTNQDDARKKAEKLVDFIIASDRLEGLATPPGDRETLIKIVLGEIDIDEYIGNVSDQFREKAEIFRATNGSSYNPSGPNNRQPHPRFHFNKDTDDGQKTD